MTGHTCPGPGCEAQVPRAQLACHRHWFQVPQEVRSAVHREYRKAPLSAAHRAAVAAAIEAMKP